MTGFIDLHCHYIPGIDDGVKTDEDGVALLRDLHAIGFERVVATPHIRSAMFENRKAGLESAYAAFCERIKGEAGLPQTGLGAEHFFDDTVWQLFQKGEMCPYPGGHAVLVEFPERAFPFGVTERFFQMHVRGLRPVLAHPERYSPLSSTSEPVERMVNSGVLLLLDVMSLEGKYGSAPRKAAERMLEEGLYYAACSDTHRPNDVAVAEKAIARLRELVGDDDAEMLLADHPQRILDGRIDV